MLDVDRGNFVGNQKYQDSPVQIGYGATISAPHMVLFIYYFINYICFIKLFVFLLKHACALELLKDHLKEGKLYRNAIAFYNYSKTRRNCS